MYALLKVVRVDVTVTVHQLSTQQAVRIRVPAAATVEITLFRLEAAAALVAMLAMVAVQIQLTVRQLLDFLRQLVVVGVALVVPLGLQGSIAPLIFLVVGVAVWAFSVKVLLALAAHLAEAPAAWVAVVVLVVLMEQM